jgi:hypothetical protein
MGELVAALPTASEDAVKNNEKRDGQKSAAGEVMPSVAASVTVVPVRAEVRAMKTVRVPERAENETEYQGDCD